MVYSHPQALAQCEQALAEMRGVEVVAVYDTAGAAKMVREGGRPGAAAVASRRAGEVFGLAVLRESIQDFTDNITRFCVIAREARRNPRRQQDVDRLCPAQQAGGAVQGARRVRAPRHQPDQARIAPAARPPLGYAFYVDVEVPKSDPGFERALADLSEFSHWVRTLGSYPSWKP